MKKRHKIALFIAYFLVFFSSLLLIDYYADMFFSFYIVAIVSAILSFVSLQIHKKYKTKTQVDELAKELEEIL